MVGANGSAFPNYKHEQPHRLNDHHSLKTDHENEHHQSLNDHHLPRSDQENDPIPHSQKVVTSPPRRARSALPSRGPKPLLPRSLKEALQLASLLSKSKLVPKGFENPEACLVGILYGMEVGLSPIAALQRMAIIEGRPTIWGDAALALVEASGLLIKIEERIEILGSQTDERSSDWPNDGKASGAGHQRPDQSDEWQDIKTRTSICQVLRSGRSDPITRSFSVEDAKRAGLWQKPGPWTDYPDRMLMMRARAFALRDAFPDVLMGLYIREEFEGSNNQGSINHQDKMQSDWDQNAPNQPKIQSDWDEPSPSRTGRKESDINTTSLAGDFNEDRQASGPNDRERVWHPYQAGGMRDRKLDTPNTIGHSRRRAPPPPPIEVEIKGLPITENQPSVSSKYLDKKEDLPELAGSEEAASYHTVSDTLELFDSALACAKDEETLEEIRQEFNERIDCLDSGSLQEAGRIFMRHEKRIRATEDTFKIKAQSFEPTSAPDISVGSSNEDRNSLVVTAGGEGLTKSERGLLWVEDEFAIADVVSDQSEVELKSHQDSSFENVTGRIGKEPLNPHRRRRFSIRPRKGLSLAELNARRKVDLLKYLPRSSTNEDEIDE
jgi:RecT family